MLFWFRHLNPQKRKYLIQMKNVRPKCKLFTINFFFKGKSNINFMPQKCMTRVEKNKCRWPDFIIFAMPTGANPIFYSFFIWISCACMLNWTKFTTVHNSIMWNVAVNVRKPMLLPLSEFPFFVRTSQRKYFIIEITLYQ